MRLLQYALLLACIATPLVFAQPTHVPTPTTWTLSLPESNFVDDPAGKGGHLITRADTGKPQKWSGTFIHF